MQTVCGFKVKKRTSSSSPEEPCSPCASDHKGGRSFRSQWERSPLRGQSWVQTMRLPLKAYSPGPAPPSQRHLPEEELEANSIRSRSLPQTGKPAHSSGILSNHRPKKAKFILTSNDAFVLNFRPVVSLQTCSFPAKRRNGWRSILASALSILRQFPG